VNALQVLHAVLLQHAAEATANAARAERRAVALEAEVSEERSTAERLRERAAAWEAQAADLAQVNDAPAGEPTSWRERIWSVAPETRLSLAEAAQAIGCSRTKLYRGALHGFSNGGRPPYRREVNGAYAFVAGELRHWILQNEQIEQAGLTIEDAATAVTARRIRRSPHRSNSHG
jgi:hypothetical protein